jgi:hypothetical protein
LHAPRRAGIVGVVSVPLGPGLSSRRVRVSREEVAWVRYVLEAHDGLANLYGDGTDVITLVTPTCNEAELDAVIAELGLVPVEEGSIVGQATRF